MGNQASVLVKGTRINGISVTSKGKWKKALQSLPQSQHLISFLSEWWGNNNDFIVLQTSGSTGKPKQIRAPKEYLKISARRTNHFFSLTKNSTALITLPITYIAGKMMVIRALEGGYNLTITPPTSKANELPSNSFDFAPFTPFQISKLIETEKGQKHLQNIKTLLLGGAKVTDELARKLQHLSLHAFESFGMTETFSHIALRKISPRAENYFTAVKGITFEQTNDECLIILGEGIPKGKVITTDRVELHSSTQFKWLGRKDLVINSGGIKIQTEEVENLLQKQLNTEAYLSWVSDNELGQKSVLLLNVKVPPSNLRKAFTKLSTYQRPKKTAVIPNFPKTENGKIKRNALQKIAAGIQRWDEV